MPVVRFIFYTPAPKLLSRCYRDMIPGQRITFSYDLLQSKGEYLAVGMKCNLVSTEGGSVEVSFHFITSLICFANMTLLACHVQASTRVRTALT
jgi:hypothetical protein